MDKEFDVLKGDLSMKGIDFNPASAHEHVPEIEQCNRIIKEQVCGVYCTLPYTALPLIMIQELVNFCAM
eukprot:8227454-Ditylum_brightwellii.AAC.1